MSKILTVIFGAGASFDCQSQYHHNPKRVRIPLTDELFIVPDVDAPHFKRQKEILKKYRGADFIGRIFERQRTTGIRSLEEFLKESLRTGTVNTEKNLRQIPFYLRELIGDFGELVRDEFRMTDYVNLINRLDVSNYEKIILITLNYDLLLDWALESVVHAKLNTFASYLGHQNRWYYLKYHGSVNWVYEINSDSTSLKNEEEVLDWLCDIDPAIDLPGEGKYIRNGNYGILRKQGDKRILLHPMMVLPNAEQKTHICPDEHIKAVRPLLNECNHFMIIGNSMQDIDITELLKRDARKASKVFILDHVGAHVQGVELRRRVSEIFPHTDIKMEPDMGFSNYVGTLNPQKKLFDNSEEVHVL